MHRRSIPVRKLGIFSLSPFPSITLFQNSPNRENLIRWLRLQPCRCWASEPATTCPNLGWWSRLAATLPHHCQASEKPREASHVIAVQATTALGSQATASRASRRPRRAAQGQSQRPRNNSPRRQPILHRLSKQHKRVAEHSRPISTSSHRSPTPSVIEPPNLYKIKYDCPR